jgi:ketosteroid isomerase-like protein
MRPATRDEWFAIHETFVRYATCLDHGDVEGVVACFAEDAALASPVLGRFAGHAGIRDFAQRTADLLAQGVQFRHVVSNLVARVEADRALARCYLLDFRTRAGRTSLLSPGEYDCELRRAGDRWLFVRRDVTMDQAFTERDL